MCDSLRTTTTNAVAAGPETSDTRDTRTAWPATVDPRAGLADTDPGGVQLQAGGLLHGRRAAGDQAQPTATSASVPLTERTADVVLGSLLDGVGEQRSGARVLDQLAEVHERDVVGDHG